MTYMNEKKKDKLDDILYHIILVVLILSGITILIGVFADIPKVMFCGIGVFGACMCCAVINDPPTHYDDE